ncbi:unnamed protein product [Ostreobium quekettii]|uniref:Uncharacterized protein n=1 Tax=Ostreobium quekettii TaxID=121088 RepID=A0A8S1J4X7_9CHLO|nr:unnamed protein product [Ostreobium quekettii]
MFVGRLGPNELGALGVNTALYSLAFFLFNFLASTTTPLVATAVAAQDKDKAGQVTIQGLILAGVLGISLLGGLVIGQDWFLGVMGADGSMLAPAKEYLVARSFAAPAVLVVLVGTGVLRGLQDMKTPLLITLFANAANLVLDPILIYSFDLGVRGAAVATTAAEWLSAGAYVMVLWRERETLGLDCSYSVAVRRAQADYLPFLQAGGTVLLRTFVLLFTKTFASSVATHLGPVNIAAHQVVAQFWLLHSLTTDSLAVSAQSLVAVALGKGDMRQARGLSDRLLQFGIALGVFWTFFLQAASPVLPSIFTSDGTVATAVYSIAPIATFVLPISSAAYVYDGIFIGAKDFRFLAFSMSSAAVCVCTALFLVEPLGWGLPGVWWCQSGMLILRASILTWRYQQQRGPVPRQISKPVEEGTVAVVDNEELEGSVRR